MSDHQSTPQVRAKREQKALTERFIETVKEPGYYWDATVPAFGIRVGKTRKTFTVIRGKRRERITIGLWPSISLADARKRARAILLAKPRIEGSTGFIEALDEFIKKHVDHLKSGQGMERILRKHFTWSKSLHLVTRQDIQEVLDDLSETPSEANHAFAYLRTFFMWCIRRGLIDHSPMTAMKRPYKETSRDRVLTPDELVQIWHTLKDDPFGRNVKLLILTGCRKSEIQNLIVDGDTATLPAQHSKNGREHVFPLPKMALPLFHDLNFNGWSKAKARLDKKCGVYNWTLHDCRRSYASFLASLGVAPHIIAALMNHVSEGLSPIQRIYVRHTYQKEMREAVDSYETFLQSLLARAN